MPLPTRVGDKMVAILHGLTPSIPYGHAASKPAFSALTCCHAVSQGHHRVTLSPSQFFFSVPAKYMVTGVGGGGKDEPRLGEHGFTH